MTAISRVLALLMLVAASLLVAQQPAHSEDATVIGGQPIVVLTRKAVSKKNPEFTSVTVLPGRGMEVLQITANFPGIGNVDVLASPDLETAKKQLDEDNSMTGAQSYLFGSAFLVPYPNRIRGKLSADQKTITTQWHGHTITLPANNIGKLPTAERHAMHGLILRSKTDDVKVTNIPGGQQLTGVIHAGDFGGDWLSKTDLNFTIQLMTNVVDAIVTARNVGKIDEPMAIAWHPYFNLPSGNRKQARLQIPASNVAEVDGYDNVFPTGKLLPVEGTKFDLREQNGKPLGDIFFDDNWSHLDREEGIERVRLIDPAAHYGIDVEGISPEIHAIQVYAPTDKNFVAIEDQYNFGDPFGKEWGKTDTGMVTLKPGQNTMWHVRLHVFAPKP